MIVREACTAHHMKSLPPILWHYLLSCGKKAIIFLVTRPQWCSNVPPRGKAFLLGLCCSFFSNYLYLLISNIWRVNHINSEDPYSLIPCSGWAGSYAPKSQPTCSTQSSCSGGREVSFSTSFHSFIYWSKVMFN